MTATLTTLANFNGSNGSFPQFGSLLLDANGDLFGATGGGGSANEGTVFELVKNGSSYTLTTLVNFNGSNGSLPLAGLIADANGDLFGTREGGGWAKDGAVFERGKNGRSYTRTTLSNFNCSNGTRPFAGLIADANGDLFGTTQGGGSANDGTVFELVKNGSSYTLTTLVNFNGSNGGLPIAGLIADANGDLF